MSDDVSGRDWSDSEVDLIVADYFAMLQSELAGSTYSKVGHNRALQQLTGRTHGSIEFKHQNIGAVLVRLGLPWIKGYKPMANFQNALRKFDPAARDARNRALGKQGEELVLSHEHTRLVSFGRSDLARRLKWTSEVEGDGAGYDIRSFNLDGSDRLIEVKTTNGAALTPFYLTENERLFSEGRPEAFRLVRLHDFREKPTGFELAPPLDHWLKLMPTVYRASF